MKINEIVSSIEEIYTYPATSTNIFKYYEYFRNVPRNDSPFDNLKYSNVQNYDSDYFGLLHNDRLISIVHVDLRDNSEYYQLTYTETDKEFRRQGCFRYLLMKAVEKYNTIISDDRQTKDAENSWRTLIQYPSERLQFKMYNTITKTIEDIDVDKIWNNSDEYVVLVTNKHFTTEMLERSNIRDRYTKFSNTHFEGIWFGKHTSNEEYNNP